MTGRLLLRWIALGYLAVLLVLPVGMVFWQAFAAGTGAVWQAITHPQALHALWLTVTTAFVAVALNTVFGVACAILLVRHRFPGRALVDRAVDLPFAVSPVMAGLALVIVFGRQSPLGAWLFDQGVRVLFAPPGIVLATLFVSLPFVVREVAPVLREIGTEQEEAAVMLGASAWQAFWHITLPSVRWGVAYGVVLTTARALGEFGAVSVVSGRIAGGTETLTVYVEQRFQAFDLVGAYTAAVILALLALGTLVAMNLALARKEAQ